MNYPFTVKICEFNGGETLMPAVCVEAVPFNPDTPKEPNAEISHVLIFHSEGEAPEEVFNGRVFVMNEIGKTVARYTIEGKE